MNDLEKQRKLREAVEYAIRTHEIEGFVFTEEDKEEFERIIRGEITLEESIKKHLEAAYAEGKKYKKKIKAMNNIDSYVYPGTYILRNKFDMISHEELSRYERVIAAARLMQFYINPVKGNFDFEHFKKIHHHIFQDIYDWAGKERTVNIAKGTTVFCLVQNIKPYADTIFSDLKKDNCLKNLGPDDFSKKTAHYLNEINLLHPFREGNGRTQREFIRELALNAGYDLNFSKVTAREMIEASIKSLYGLNGFERLIKTHLKPANSGLSF